MSGYKAFKGAALSDAAFKRKYGMGIRTRDVFDLDLIRASIPALPSVSIPANDFVAQMKLDLATKQAHNKISVEKLAASFGITDKTQVKELTELAIVESARAIALAASLCLEEKYEQIVALYKNQVNLSHRTSQSILLQQYSTPAPIGFLMGIFCGIDQLHLTGGYAFEPSAGNGQLTIAANPSRVYVNEVDDFRRGNLQKQGYANVWDRDATIDFFDVRRTFAAVLTNPPFGSLEQKVLLDNYPINSLEHLMAIRALDTMMNDGKAAIIIGGHHHWDEKGRLQAGSNRIFFNYLYHYYHVADVLQIDGAKLYSRQGTSFNTRLILIDGRKEKAEGAAPLFNKENDTVVRSFEDLWTRVMANININNALSVKNNNHTILDQSKSTTQAMSSIQQLSSKAQKLAALLNNDTLKGLQNLENLGAPYNPASDACIVLDTQVPDSMAFETQEALEFIRNEVGGNADDFVRERLGYPNKVALCKALAAEQIDAVMMAIYNIEAREQGMIIGDQTGIGKGRVAAAIIRYACTQGFKPIFLTEKANLFSDIYRDLKAIGSGALVPFIVNGKESKTDIKDEDGNIIYQALAANEQLSIFRSREIPAKYDFVVATYSQFNSPEKKPEKPNFLNAIAADNIFILDEAHNSSGSSNTGAFLQGVVSQAKGVAFLSATFAKRPDNMPIYAMKTAIADCNMSKEELVEAIQRGGVALQEVLSAQLVAEGQMLRRERSFEGIEVNYVTLDEQAEEHRAIADNITQLLRDIIAFQSNHITPQVDELDNIALASGKEMVLRAGTSQAGVDNLPYFSKVFNVINQMLFSIKAASVADRAIERLREGKKPVIAFASTMGSFLDTLGDENGLPIGDGSIINADFAEVLKRGLDGVMRYTEKDVDGTPIYRIFALDELSPEAQIEYQRISEQIATISTGITISPIDVVIQRIKAAGYTVAEVTGRKYEMQLNFKGSKALVLSRKKINTNDAFRQFNNNEVDVLMINQSGSTGASAHAIATAKVPAHEVRQRVMIVLQAELDINTEVQKRGRINRTGQILKPIYDYVSSAIPAEKRLMMMLQKKLKSLDANTASNQKQSNKILDVPDFLNKYGDKIVKEYLSENPDINALLDDPLKLAKAAEGDTDDKQNVEDAAHKVSGRVAVLSTKMQQEFYNEVAERYIDYVAYLQQIGEYDLELEAMNLDAETISSKVVKMGLGSDSVFGENSVLETVKANVLKKPFTAIELDNFYKEALKGDDAKVLQQSLLTEYIAYVQKNLEEAEWNLLKKYEEEITNIPNEKKIKKLVAAGEDVADIILEREKELNEAKTASIAQLRAKSHNRRFFMEKAMKFFFIGRQLYYPAQSFGTEKELVPTICLGFVVDYKKKNPFAASVVKLRFALANSSKYLVMPLSYFEDISAIMGVSSDVPQRTWEDLLVLWEKIIQQNNSDRNVRHIVTGNLLQAFADFKGKLVSYTTIDGKVEKGILMPEHWEADKTGMEAKVSVPIIKALPFIRSLMQGQSMQTSTGITFIKVSSERLKVIVAGSKAKGGDIFLDPDLLPFVEGENFSKVSDKMVAFLDLFYLDDFVAMLQKKHSCSVMLSSQQFKSMQHESKVFSNRKPIRMPEPERVFNPNDLLVLKLKSKAILLKLKLMSN